MSRKNSARIQDKVCRNHPERAATERCETCFTPICAECVYERHDVPFCSRNCAANYDVVHRNLDRFEKKKKTDRKIRFRRRLKMILRISLYAIILLFLWWVYVTYTEQVHYWLDRIINMGR